MAFDPHDPETYFEDPRTRRWLVRCASCDRIGYRADMPTDAFNRYWMERKLEAMTLDEHGRCEVCAEARQR
jgi:hypothetical protein